MASRSNATTTTTSPAKRLHSKLEEDAVAVVPFTASHLTRAANILNDAFRFDDYSWERALRRNGNLMYYLREMHLPGLLDNGMCSVVAFARRSALGGKSQVEKDGASAEVELVGVLTIEPMEERHRAKPAAAGAEEEKPAERDEAQNAVTAILNKANVLFWDHVEKNAHLPSFKDVKREEIAYFAFLGVDQQARRLGLGARLLRETEERFPKTRVARRSRPSSSSPSSGEKASEEGGGDWTMLPRIRVGTAFCTSPKSRDLFAKDGFELVATVEYRTFQVEGGATPFASLPDGLYVMVKKYV